MKRVQGFPYPLPDDYEDASYLTRERMMEAMGKMDRARAFLTVQEPWYGHFAIQMEWEPSTTLAIPTMGVTILQNGKIQCWWHPMFVLTRSIYHTASAIKHEIEHIVRLHPVRCGDRDRKKWNTATDMAINGSREEQNIAVSANSESPKVLPFMEEENVQPIWRPRALPAAASAEELYDLLPKSQCPSCGGSGQRQPSGGQKPKGGNGSASGGKGGTDRPGDGDSDGDSGSPEGHGSCHDCNGSGQNGGGQIIDDHASWEESSATPEHARQIVQGVVSNATKSCGRAPGNLIKAIEALSQPIIDWRHEFRTVFGRSVGKSRITWSRMDRRRPVFGVPGKTSFGSGRALIVCDTSGSVSAAEYEQFFGEIDGSICQNVDAAILQWDDRASTAANEMRDIYWPHYQRGHWRQIKRKGGGGTDMGAAVVFAAQHGLLRGVDVIAILTDGLTPWFSGKIGIPIINVITGAQGSASPSPPSTQTNLYMNMGRGRRSR
jgi:predicted metal-dependent peptidase